MAKFTIILAALFVALFALAEATAYKTITTTTTTIIEEEDPRQSKCSQQQQQLSHCRMYLSPQSESLRSRMAIMNAREEHLQDCCQQLQQLERECVCKAIQQIVSQRQGQQQTEQMMQDAQNLPRKCNIQLSQPCQIQDGSF